MSKILVRFVTSMLLAALAASPAAAQDPASFIKQDTTDGVTYASGGVSFEERQAMEAMAKDFNLKLVFAVGSGAFLSGLTVVIQDEEGGTLIQTASNGPWFFAKLPEGQYTITVGDEAHKKVDAVTVGGGLTTVTFHWKS